MDPDTLHNVVSIFNPEFRVLRTEEKSIGLDQIFVPAGTVKNSAAVHCRESGE
jgi:hypothetical protein